LPAFGSDEIGDLPFGRKEANLKVTATSGVAAQCGGG
jgi:hypothetical protein